MTALTFWIVIGRPARRASEIDGRAGRAGRCRGLGQQGTTAGGEVGRRGPGINCRHGSRFRGSMLELTAQVTRLVKGFRDPAAGGVRFWFLQFERGYTRQLVCRKRARPRSVKS